MKIKQLSISIFRFSLVDHRLLDFVKDILGQTFLAAGQGNEDNLENHGYLKKLNIMETRKLKEVIN
jgi:hypothetical protein